MINAKHILISITFSFLCACVRPTAAPSSPTETTSSETITIDGVVRSYHLHRPPGSLEGLPLLISLHGLGGSAAAQERLSGLSTLADEERFVAVYPEGEPFGRLQGWRVGAGSPDVEFLTLLVDHLVSTFNLDNARVYLIGHSNGGGMVHRAACEIPQVFAAVGGVAGAYPSSPDCIPSAPIGIIIVHSLDDPIVPYEGSAQTSSLPIFAAAWVERNMCTVGPETYPLERAVELTRWEDCLEGVEVSLVTLDGVGHRWPGGPGVKASLNASAVMWAFFEDHSKATDNVP